MVGGAERSSYDITSIFGLFFKEPEGEQQSSQICWTEQKHWQI